LLVTPRDDGYLRTAPGRTNVGKRGCDLITELAAQGYANGTIARALRITVQQRIACRKCLPEVAEAFERGEAALPLPKSGIV